VFRAKKNKGTGGKKLRDDSPPRLVRANKRMGNRKGPPKKKESSKCGKEIGSPPRGPRKWEKAKLRFLKGRWG